MSRDFDKFLQNILIIFLNDIEKNVKIYYNYFEVNNMRKKTLKILLNETNKKLNLMLAENEQLREKIKNANTKIEFLEAADKPLTQELESIKAQNSELILKLEQANIQSDEGIAEFEEKINQLLAENNQLKGELYEAKKLSEDLLIKMSANEQIETEEISIHTPPPTVHKPISADKKDPAAFDYASTIISKIVLRTASFKNIITSSGDQNSAELITLALGKAEMFKAEVLQTVMCDENIEDKIKKMDSLLADAEEYFNSLEGQVTNGRH